MAYALLSLIEATIEERFELEHMYFIHLMQNLKDILIRTLIRLSTGDESFEDFYM